MGLTPERWQEVLRLHESASALPLSERAEFLVRECSDPEVREEVRRMLAAPSSDDFLAPPSLDEPVPGRDLGDFTLLEEIGRGGMGVVYRALQRSLKRIVAVKVLPASFAMTPRQIERFEREARSAARLSHPNLVAVLTVGNEGGVRYFAMEYVEGHNLADELKRLRTHLGTDEHDRAHLPSSHAAEYFRSIAECMRQAADGLAFAHAHRVIHRDVKPSNLLLDSSGKIKLVDFGLARDEEMGTPSASGDVLGTPHYMSPEQARAHRHQIDHRTDVYSLGVVLYELLTLQRPFEGKTSQEVIDNLLRRDATAVRKLNPRVPRDLATICSKAMGRDPRDRYGSADDMRDDLQRFLAHEAIVARPPGVLEILARRLRRNRVGLSVVAVALVAVLVGGAFERAQDRRSARLAHLAAVRTARADGPLRSHTLSRQIELRRRLVELRLEGQVVAADGGDEVLGLEREFADLKRELWAAASASLRASKEPACPAEDRLDLRLEALLHFVHLAQLYPEDEELRDLARPEVVFPSLSVETFDEDGAAVEASASLREIREDTSVAPEHSLGRTPLVLVPIRPGHYRLTVAFDSGGFRELSLLLSPSDGDERIRVQRRANEPSIGAGMEAFDACDYAFPEEAFYDVLEGRSVHLEPYLLDQAEVSNREYARFVRATGRALPVFWTDLPDLEAFLERHGEKPVVGVSVPDAEAYAAWVGKRLPSVAEWLRAAGGLEKRAHPYLTRDPGEPPRGNVLAPMPERGSPEEGWQAYLEHAADVRSHPDARTPEGLFHMWGNVFELTESTPLGETRDGRIERHPQARILLGGSWSAIRESVALLSPSHIDADPLSHSWRIGFRCAKSLKP